MNTAVQTAMNEALAMIREQKSARPDRYARNSFATLLDYVRSYMNDAREEIGAPMPRKPVPAIRPATFTEIVDDLWVSAARMGQFGATRAQIETIARLAVNAGLSLGKVSCATLTRGEASNIISTFN